MGVYDIGDDPDDLLAKIIKIVRKPAESAIFLRFRRFTNIFLT